jgi:pilus assembly protein CpaC
MKPLIAIALAGLTLASVAPAAPSQAQAQSRAAVPLGVGAQLINLPRGSSMAIDLPSDARDVIVPNPVVAEAMLHSPRRITIIGLQPGETDAVVLDSSSMPAFPRFRTPWAGLCRAHWSVPRRSTTASS